MTLLVMCCIDFDTLGYMRISPCGYSLMCKPCSISPCRTANFSLLSVMTYREIPTDVGG